MIVQECRLAGEMNVQRDIHAVNRKAVRFHPKRTYQTGKEVLWKAKELTKDHNTKTN